MAFPYPTTTAPEVPNMIPVDEVGVALETLRTHLASTKDHYHVDRLQSELLDILPYEELEFKDDNTLDPGVEPRPRVLTEDVLLDHFHSLC